MFCSVPEVECNLLPWFRFGKGEWSLQLVGGNVQEGVLHVQARHVIVPQEGRALLSLEVGDNDEDVLREVEVVVRPAPLHYHTLGVRAGVRTLLYRHLQGTTTWG